MIQILHALIGQAGIFQIRLGLRNLIGDLLFAARVKRHVGELFLRLDHAKQLPVGHRAAFLDEQLLQTALNFRADDDFIGCDDAG